MKNYIKKTELLAMQFDGSIAQLVELQKRYGSDFDITPDETSLVFVNKKDEEAKTLVISMGEWLVEHKGNLHVVDAETFRNEYYLARGSEAKEEKKPAATKKAATKPQSTKSEEASEDKSSEDESDEMPEKKESKEDAPVKSGRKF